jgi:hypothetical protein
VFEISANLDSSTLSDFIESVRGTLESSILDILMSPLDTLLIAPLMKEISFHLEDSVGGRLELRRRAILDCEFFCILKSLFGIVQCRIISVIVLNDLRRLIN